MAGKPTLLEVDISSPARPRALRSVEVPGYYHQLAIDGGLLFAAENGNGQFSEAGLTIVRTHLGETATATPDGTSPTPGASPSPTATAPTPAVSATATASLPPGPPDVLYFPFADR